MADRIALQILCREEDSESVMHALSECIAVVNEIDPVLLTVLGRVEGISQKDQDADECALIDYVQNDWAIPLDASMLDASVDDVYFFGVDPGVELTSDS